MTWKAADLFSGAGGMSSGFQAHPSFEVVAAVDAQRGKPSSGDGVLDCNQTYEANVGVKPFERDLQKLDGPGLVDLLRPVLGTDPLDVLLACPPCTGFSRTNPQNHLGDDHRNSLVGRVALWVEALKPKVVLMENARELINGNFAQHYGSMTEDLENLGYSVYGSIHMLDRFGLAQRRERALVVAARKDLELCTLDSLWKGFGVKTDATTVRSAIGGLPPVEAGVQHPDDAMHVSPKIGRSSTLRRLELLPHDGGSWASLKDHAEAEEVLTPAMKRYIARGKFGSHPDIYGRMWWDRPAITIKRECAHFGNGRYSHPEQNRLLTVREMAILQGFPRSYTFVADSLSNMYRHIGDAVPPLVSFQLAWAAHVTLGGERPRVADLLLPGTHLTADDTVEAEAKPEQRKFRFTEAV